MRHARGLGGCVLALFLGGCPGGGGGGGGDGSVAAGSHDGGARDLPGFDFRITLPPSGMADVRFVNVFAPGGDKSPLDLSVQVNGAWQRLATGLAYGTATAHLPVPLAAFGDTLVVITAVGGDPSMVKATDDRTLLLGLKNGDRNTTFFFDTRDGKQAPEPNTHLEWSDFGDRAAAFTAPAGKALIQGVKQTISSTEFFWGWGLQGMGCLGGGDGLNNEQQKVDPGTYVVSGVNTDNPGCMGPTLIMPVSITAAAGSTYFVYPVGEEMAELQMVALPAVP
jgi:hypothetical protein